MEVAERARAAMLGISNSNLETRNKIILKIANEIDAERERLKDENSKDVKDASDASLRGSVVKRLELDDPKIDAIIKGLMAVAKLEDPINQTVSAIELDHGLELYRVTCPIGVVAAIFESRPDALVQIASLCLKSANAAILKGGKEAMRSNRLFAEAIRRSIRRVGEIPEDSVQMIETREDIDTLLKLDKYVDLLLPRIKLARKLCQRK